jgi:hypothetical protein
VLGARLALAALASVALAAGLTGFATQGGGRRARDRDYRGPGGPEAAGGRRR